jgi:hypothetical protein
MIVYRATNAERTIVFIEGREYKTREVFSEKFNSFRGGKRVDTSMKRGFSRGLIRDRKVYIV